MVHTLPTGAVRQAGAERVALPLMIGARTLWRVRRRLVKVPLSLSEVLAGDVPDLPPLRGDADGYLINSLPSRLAAPLAARHPRLKPFVRQRYRRSYAALDRGFEAWLAGLSAKSRSTLRRKVRRFAERSGGALDLRCYRREADVAEFHRHAREVSARTYQERLLGAGLPDGEEALERIRALAGAGRMRGWVLFLEDRPVSYLYAPAEGRTLLYSHLGYDPAFADLSPGTVLQFEAMRQLMEEGAFALFDFTEGEGQHKLQFGTGSVECVDLLLFRRTPANLLTGLALNGFDRAVAAAKAIALRGGLGRLARRAGR